MRVLFTAHQFFPDHKAGTEVLTLGIAKAMKSLGHEPFVLAAMESRPHGDISPYETRDYVYEGIPVRRVGRPKSGLVKRYSLEYDNPRMAEIIADYTRELKPDVVHAMHLQGLSAAVVPAVKSLGIPVVYTATDFWGVCPVVDLLRHDGVVCRGPSKQHCPKCVFGRARSRPLKNTVENTPGSVFATTTRISKSLPVLKDTFPFELLSSLDERPAKLRELLSEADVVISPTTLTKRLLEENGVGDGNIRVCGYGVDTSGLEPVKREEDGTLRVGYIGTLVRHKGCDVLARAFRSIPSGVDMTLDIYGNRRQYPEYVEELDGIVSGDRRVRFRGTFSPKVTGEVLSEMDVLVVPSRWYENTPLVLFSAFASGTPVVATDLGGLSEVVHHGENGLLFPVNDVENLARQLTRLAEESELLGRLREGIVPVKTVEENAREMLEVYREILRDRRDLG